MATRGDDSLATLLLTGHLTETASEPFGPVEFWDLVATVGEPRRLLGSGNLEVAATVGDPGLADRILTLLDAATQLAFALERFEAKGFAVLTPYDDGYPQRLRERLVDQAPPVLFAAGAPGVDKLAMAAAYRAGGRVIGYLGEPLQQRIKAPGTRRVIAEGAVCLATQFKPDADSSARSALARNKLIYATARTTLAVATEEGKGGTWDGATEAIRHGYGHVSVWRGQGEGRGNAALAANGARPIESLARLLHPIPEPNKRSAE